MQEAGRRTRTQPPPPSVVFEALTHPNRDAARPWLALLADERTPQILREEPPRLVVWSSVWERRPDAQVTFELASDGHGGTQLQWTLHVAEPLPDPALLGHMRKRLNELINANLRYTFGA
jgi:hypothetical protein